MGLCGRVGSVHESTVTMLDVACGLCLWVLSYTVDIKY
jgi:hypothetical protein